MCWLPKLIELYALYTSLPMSKHKTRNRTAKLKKKTLIFRNNEFYVKIKFLDLKNILTLNLIISIQNEIHHFYMQWPQFNWVNLVYFSSLFYKSHKKIHPIFKSEAYRDEAAAAAARGREVTRIKNEKYTSFCRMRKMKTICRIKIQKKK